ncbi:argonaute 5 [Orobanche gracilis]
MEANFSDTREFGIQYLRQDQFGGCNPPPSGIPPYVNSVVPKSSLILGQLSQLQDEPAEWQKPHHWSTMSKNTATGKQVYPPQEDPMEHQRSDHKAMCPARPGFGHAGVQCMIKANQFLLDVEVKYLLVYYVSVEPRAASEELRTFVVHKAFERFIKLPDIIFHGSGSIYYVCGNESMKDFPRVWLEIPYHGVSVKWKGDDLSYRVTFKLCAECSFDDFDMLPYGLQGEILKILDAHIRRKHIRIDNGMVLGDGAIYWKGFYQSLRLTHMGPSLRIGTCAKVLTHRHFVSDFVLLCGVDFEKNLTRKERVRLEASLKGIKVKAFLLGLSHTPKYRIKGIARKSSKNLRFTFNGEDISLCDYFLREHKTKIGMPNLPPLEVDSKTPPYYIPMEICLITSDQRYRKTLNQEQSKALFKSDCASTKSRQSWMKEIIVKNYNYESIGFGLKVREQMASIEARVLPPPKLRYDGGIVVPSEGRWNMMDKKMFSGGNLESWACINISRLPITVVKKFCNDLIETCIKKGMNCNPEPSDIISCVQPSAIKTALRSIKAKTTSALGLVIIILHKKSDVYIYGKIKRICEIELGIISQCFQPKTLVITNEKKYKQCLENVSLKINAKMGGRNSVLENALRSELPYVSDCRTIIFGAAVTHPQPWDNSSPSVAGVVASMDWPHVATYKGVASTQAHREEIIQDLYSMEEDPIRGIVHGGMVRELLLSYKEVQVNLGAAGAEHMCLPKRIIIYRNGVSEGQFHRVLLHEMDAVKKACKSIHEDYEPTITFIVVQKRHHTHLFAANDGGTEDEVQKKRGGNVMPGTVVDTKICHPSGFDFYLCSHAGTKGTTSRPIHYHVLYDENEFTADGMQSLTNDLCYTYARCTRSLSIVPPVYYAHLVARRARYYIHRRGKTAKKGVQTLPEIMDNVKRCMFYI